MNLTQEQYQLLFTAVRYYQTYVSLPNTDHHLYNQCNDILDQIFPYAYSQRLEQPT